MNESVLIGAIEAGGTKTICALGQTWTEVRDGEKLTVPTTTPRETASRVVDWMLNKSAGIPIDAIGVATFGPIEFSNQSISVATPKSSWRGVSWSDLIREDGNTRRVIVDTDTNGAGIAESRWGASIDCQVSVYLTIGTGIGGGLIVENAAVHGLQHPEMGHMFVPRVSGDDFPGNCPSHGDCLEGLASGTAIRDRWGVTATSLPPDHFAWDIESAYLASAIANITALCSPEVIVLGGGVMDAIGLIEKVRLRTQALLGDYFSCIKTIAQFDRYLVKPGLAGNSGVIGAFALAWDSSPNRVRS